MKTNSSVSSFESVVGRKLFLLAGIFLIIFGLGYFIKYSFDRNLIPPVLRIIMAYAFSAGFLFAGEFFRRRKYPMFGNCLAACGIAGLYSSTYGAYAIYELFPASAAMVIFSTITVFSSIMSVFYNTVWLAHISCAGGFMTPYLISSTTYTALMVYITILDIGILYIALRKQWLSVQFSGFASTWFVYFTGNISTAAPLVQQLLFLSGFFFIYSFTPLYGSLMLNEKRFYRTNFLILCNATVAFLLFHFTVISHFGPKTSAVGALAFSAYFAAWSFAARLTGRKPVFTVTVAMTAFFSAVCIPLMFSAHWISVFMGFLALATLWTGIKLDEKPLVTGSFGLFMLSAFRTLFVDTFYFGFDISRWSFTVSEGLLQRIIYHVCIIAIFLTAAYLLKTSDFYSDKQPLFLFYCFIFSYASCLIECSVLKQTYPAYFHPALTIITALFAVFFLFISQNGKHVFPLVSGIILLGNAVFKMFFVDIFSRFNPDTGGFIGGFSDILSARYLMYAVVLTGLFKLCSINRVKIEENNNYNDIHVFTIIITSISLFSIANIETFSFFQTYLPVAKSASVSILWAAISYYLIWNGLKTDNPNIRKTGITLCFFTITKVLLIDMSNYATPYRILSAMLTGLILIAVSFQYHKLLNQTENSSSNADSVANVSPNFHS